MTVRSLPRGLFAAALGLWMLPLASAQEPSHLNLTPGATVASQQASPNQTIADNIAEQIRQSGRLHRYTLTVTFLDGTAELRGSVADEAQRADAVRIAQGVPGVQRVVDRLSVGEGSVIRPVQNGLPPAPLPAAGPAVPPPPGAPPGAVAEPVPIFSAPPPTPYDVNVPKMPPYAWPTYAPYNNYSRVAYPLEYPYQAWPYIGPVYPFPKVPLGWRKVKLEWEDGHWWFSQVGCQHDWWHLRYW